MSRTPVSQILPGEQPIETSHLAEKYPHIAKYFSDLPSTPDTEKAAPIESFGSKFSRCVVEQESKPGFSKNSAWALCEKTAQQERDAELQAAEKQTEKRIEAERIAERDARRLKEDQKRNAISKCITSYEPPTPSWEWALWLFLPPTFGVAGVGLFAWAAFFVCRWVYRGFRHRGVEKTKKS